MHRCRSGQCRQDKEHQAGPVGHHRNNNKPDAVPTGRSFDGKGDANDEEQRRQDRLKQKKELTSFTLRHLCRPRKNPPRRRAGDMIQGYRLAGKDGDPDAKSVWFLINRCYGRPHETHALLRADRMLACTAD